MYGGVSVSHLYNSRRLVPLKYYFIYYHYHKRVRFIMDKIYKRILVQLPHPLYKSMQNSYNVLVDGKITELFGRNLGTTVMTVHQNVMGRLSVGLDIRHRGQIKD